jgi:hypothetical protein
MAAAAKYQRDKKKLGFLMAVTVMMLLRVVLMA